MKKVIYLVIAAALLSSCATGSKTKPVSKTGPVKVEAPVPVPPTDIEFTKVKNFGDFTSIQMPYAGSKFGKQESGGAKNDAGEYIATATYGGNHIYVRADISQMIKDDGDKSDINVALEGIKKSHYFRTMMKKENLEEEYTDVTIAGRKCKRVFANYKFISENWSSATYSLGYIVPHNETSAFIFIDKAKSELKDFETDLAMVDSVLKYMVETVEFK